ncbi:MAG: hypothetical protein M9928_14650 [Anaerolineae bacterium]|nr:hypothetical protein [Anaerolineae bacterium]MCO5191752.1 hypothetical protein [Anaerolineae bacterium]MCO5206272.1 hypothetical protein [Anaerolineae bacterium]
MNQTVMRKWLFRSFVVMLLLLTVVLYPLRALTQSNSDNRDAQQPAGEISSRTDDPAGRNYVPVDDLQLSDSNQLSAEANTAFTTTGRTDDPTGRVRIPLAETDSPATNLTQPEGNEPATTLSSTETMQREAMAAAAYTSPLVISAADFSADGFNPDSMFFSFGGGYWTGDSENYGCMIAPVYLPANATVSEMFVSVYDSDTTRNLTVNVRRVDNFNGGSDTLASASSSGDFAGVQVISDITIDNAIVQYPDYSYYATTCLLSESLRLYSLRLYYTEP